MSEPVLKCPRCSQEWQITGDGKARCGSCGYEIRLPVYICPKCAEQALVKQDDADINADGMFLCLSCRSRWSTDELERCPECFEWKPGEEFEELIICRSSVGFYVCRGCYDKIK